MHPADDLIYLRQPVSIVVSIQRLVAADDCRLADEVPLVIVGVCVRPITRQLIIRARAVAGRVAVAVGVVAERLARERAVGVRYAASPPPRR